METLEFTTIYLMCRSEQSQVFKKTYSICFEILYCSKDRQQSGFKKQCAKEYQIYIQSILIKLTVVYKTQLLYEVPICRRSKDTCNDVILPFGLAERSLVCNAQSSEMNINMNYNSVRDFVEREGNIDCAIKYDDMF